MAGAFDDAEWQRTHVELRSGETLVFYTDGVLDTHGTHERFGERRLLDALRRAPSPEPQRLVDHLARVLDDYREGVPRDDTAIVAVRYLGDPAA
jgi:serine phosphatase RsbU (regulator of sigma subunit)